MLSQMLLLAGARGWMLDLGTGRLDPRAGWAELHGLAEADPTLDAWLGSVHTDDRSSLAAAIDASRRLGAPLGVCYRLRAEADDGARLVEARGEVRLDARGRPAALIGVALDAIGSAPRQASRADSMSHLRLALRLSRTGVWDWDPATGVVRWIEGMEDLWGLQPGGFQGAYDDLAARIHPEDLRAWQDGLSACVEHGAEHDLKLRAIWPDGSVRWLGAYGNAVRDAEGKALHVAGVVRDITRYELAEDERSKFFRLSPNLFLIADFDGRILRVNDAWTEMLGYRADELAGRSLLDLVRAMDRGTTHVELERIRDGRDTRLFEARMRGKDGRVRVLVWSAVGEPETRLLYAVGQDVTDRRASETQLLHPAARYRELVEHMNDGVFVLRAVGTAPDFLLTQLNPAGAAITGVDVDEALGRPVLDVLPGLVASGVMDLIARVYHTARAEQVPMSRYVDDRRDLWIDGRLYKLPGGDVVGIFSDVTQRKLAEQTLRDARKRLETLAYYDQLTGLPNRRLLLDRLERARAVADRENDQLAVCYLDLDEFKPVNDAFGHETGDRLLRAVAERLTASVRPGDTVARWGGDEFAVLLTAVTSLETCAQTLERILRSLSERKVIEEQPKPLSASIGVTLYPHDPADAGGLLRHADHAMYLAKQRGRNNYQFFDPEEDRLAAANRELLRGVSNAIGSDELRLRYQPVVNMRSGAVDSVEALVRWQHPRRGLLMPPDFLPSIEGIELARGLDLWVLRQALAHQAQWVESGLRLKLCVNVTLQSLRKPGFIQEVAGLIAQYPGVEPRNLAFEVAETAAVHDPDTIAAVMRQAELLGITFALDDFGLGYSSLTCFRRLPASALKIDRSFVREMLTDSEDKDVVEGAIGLGKAFGRQVIAEGVETLEHGRMLLEMGCELAQGYGIAPPMHAASLAAWANGYRQPREWRHVDCVGKAIR